MSTNAAGPAPSQSNLTVGQVFVRYLALEGVHTVFGVPGGALAFLLHELQQQKNSIRYIVCRQETGAAYIADGYFRATGTLGVVIVTSGPGATNAITGTVNATTGGSALLTVTGEVSEAYFGKGYLQEGIDAAVDINAIYTAAAAYSSVVVDQSDFQTLLEQALREALSVPRRGVHLSFPNNVVAEAVPSLSIPLNPSAYRTIPTGAPLDLSRAALAQLLDCDNPLIFLGSGCRKALRDRGTLQQLVEVVETYGIPVMTTADSKGVFPESHPLSLRTFGFASCRWPALYMKPASGRSYDGLLVIGSALLGLATNNWDPTLIPNGPFIQVDLDQRVIGRALPVSLGIIGEAGAFLRNLHSLLQDFPPNQQAVAARRQAIAELKAGNSPMYYPDEYNSDQAPIEPAAIVRVLQQSLPKDSMIMLDAGNCVGWGIHCFEADPPMEIHSALAMGPMGFGVGAVIGAKLGKPEKTCVALVGDGAFMMHGAEVSTASHYNAGAIWVVLYDDDLHMVTQGQTYNFPPNDLSQWDHLYRLGSPNLAKFAEALGADAYDIESPAELQQLMPSIVQKANRDCRPQVIIAHINREAFNPAFPPRPPNPAPSTQTSVKKGKFLRRS